jgi:hypothetical protein
MRPEDRQTVLGMLDDLEMQAEGLHLAERAVEVGELGVAQYAEVELLARLHASVGGEVRVGLAEGADLRGRLAACGADWILVEDGSGVSWFAALDAVALIDGLDPRAVPDVARPLAARLSLRAVLRRLADEGRPCAVHLRGGRVLHGVLLRVGADFVELRQDPGAGATTVPLATVARIRDRA